MTLLRRYADASGHASPPQNLVIDEVALGMWVTNRRREYRQARLSAEQVKQLEELPGWAWTGTAGLWERHFTALARYVARYGHQLNDDTVFEGLRIGRWVARQRSARQRGALSEGRAARLEQLPGWHW